MFLDISSLEQPALSLLAVQSCSHNVVKAYSYLAHVQSFSGVIHELIWRVLRDRQYPYSRGSRAQSAFEGSNAAMNESMGYIWEILPAFKTELAVSSANIDGGSSANQ